MLRTLKFYVLICAVSGSLGFPGCDTAGEDEGAALEGGPAVFEDDVFEGAEPIPVDWDEGDDPAAAPGITPVPSCVACQHFDKPADLSLFPILPAPLHPWPEITEPDPVDPWDEPPVDPVLAAPGLGELTLNDLTLYWELDGDLIHFKLTGKTTGWIGVAFDPTYKMKDANFIVGYVTEEGVAILDGYGIDATSHQPDEALGGTDDVLNAQGAEEDGATTLSFSLPLSNGDGFDKPFQPGVEMLIGIAAGADGDDSFKSPHEILGFGVIRP